MSNLRMHYLNILHADMKINYDDNKHQNDRIVMMDMPKVEDTLMWIWTKVL